MARFYGSLDGSAKTQATRMGTPSTGIDGHIRGWNLGVDVRCYVDEHDADVCEVYETGGSNRPSHIRLLGKISEETAQQTHL